MHNNRLRALYDPLGVWECIEGRAPKPKSYYAASMLLWVRPHVLPFPMSLTLSS